MAQRVSIVIDGSNFYHRLREANVARPLGFDYKKFARFLIQDRYSTWQRYYIGAIRERAGNSKSRELRRGQRQLTNHLRKDGWEVVFGHMLRHDDGVYHEKGVDVLMAVDLLVGAYEDQYDTAILVSSDTDLIPALEKIRAKGKHVEYVGFSHKPSYGLITHSDVRRLLTKADLEPMINS